MPGNSTELLGSDRDGVVADADGDGVVIADGDGVVVADANGDEVAVADANGDVLVTAVVGDRGF